MSSLPSKVDPGCSANPLFVSHVPDLHTISRPAKLQSSVYDPAHREALGWGDREREIEREGGREREREKMLRDTQTPPRSARVASGERPSISWRPLFASAPDRSLLRRSLLPLSYQLETFVRTCP